MTVKCIKIILTPLPSPFPLNHYNLPSLPVATLLQRTMHPPPIIIISSPGRMGVSSISAIALVECWKAHSCASIVLSIQEALGPVSMTTKQKKRTQKREENWRKMNRIGRGSRSSCCCYVHDYNGNAVCVPWHFHLLALKFFLSFLF